LDASDLGEEEGMDFYEHYNKALCSMRGKEFLDLLND
jgi:hypothetical protein